MFNLTNNDALITIKGRAGHDAEFSGEHNVTNVRFAVSRAWPSEDDDAENGFKQVTSWFKAAAWGPNAEAAAKIRKGDVIEVSCHAADLVAEAYSTADGAPAASLKIGRCKMRVLASKAAPVEQEPAEVEL